MGTTRSLSLTVGGGFYPAVMDVEESFGEAHAEVSGLLASNTLPLQPALALHLGGKKVWGDLIPFQEAAYIGDASTVRLGRQNRYAGNASLYAQSELRLFLTKFYFLAPADFGVLGLADVGRVFLDGEESDQWHAAGGGGIWASFLDRSYMVSLSLAKKLGAHSAVLQNWGGALGETTGEVRSSFSTRSSWAAGPLSSSSAQSAQPFLQPCPARGGAEADANGVGRTVAAYHELLRRAHHDLTGPRLSHELLGSPRLRERKPEVEARRRAAREPAARVSASRRRGARWSPPASRPPWRPLRPARSTRSPARQAAVR